MRVAIMQPYFLPYLGYFKLMHEVDKFVLFDNAQMNKRSWIVRNRFSPNKHKTYYGINHEAPLLVSLPITKNTQNSLILDQKHAADDFFIRKTIKRFHSWYPNSDESFFELVYNLMSALNQTKSLVDILELQLKILSKYLRIREPELIRSSQVLPRASQNRSLGVNSPQEYIIKVCQKLEATTYVNLPNGKSLYDSSKFTDENILLKFVEFKESLELSPLLSALHYASFRDPLVMDLINQYWFINNG